MYVFRLKPSLSSRNFCKIKKGCMEAVDCWKCHKAVDCLKEKFFCPVCSAIQPVEDRNYFDYLGVRPGFDVDLSLLRRNFLKLQSAIHPDKFSGCSQKEKEISKHCSQHLNEAYKTLAEPLQRAKYLLRLKGEQVGGEDTMGSTGFLLQMMELNEQLATTDDLQELKIMLDDVERKIDILLKEFKKSIGANELSKAKEIVLKLTFYYRLKGGIANKIVDME